MRVIIAGSRTLKPHPSLISYAVYCSGFTVTEVISGDAAGIDTAGAVWANMHNIPVQHFKPNWDLYGKRAGYLRNSQMADNADALIAIINDDTESRGTRHMINIADKRDMPVYILHVHQERKNMQETKERKGL